MRPADNDRTDAARRRLKAKGGMTFDDPNVDITGVDDRRGMRSRLVIPPELFRHKRVKI